MTVNHPPRATIRSTLALVAGLVLVTAACGSSPSPNPSAATAPSATPASVSPASEGPSAVVSSAAPSSTASAAVVPDRVPTRLEPDAAAYLPVIDPSDFVTTIDNPYWPLKPGTKWTFRSADQRTETAVTTDRRPVMGVSTVVVHDQVFNGNELAEDTFDWYAQDTAGNVWYFGEDTTSYEDNPAGDKAGSWEGGVNGAQPGIVMLADPVPGDVYRQEYLAGHAEDIAMVRRLDAKLKVPQGSHTDVLVTEEWSPLEPDVIELKYYAKGVGVIEERQIFGGNELVQLTRMTPG